MRATQPPAPASQRQQPPLLRLQTDAGSRIWIGMTPTHSSSMCCQHISTVGLRTQQGMTMTTGSARRQLLSVLMMRKKMEIRLQKPQLQQ
jgi:hypothetical protein